MIARASAAGIGLLLAAIAATPASGQSDDLPVDCPAAVTEGGETWARGEPLQIELENPWPGVYSQQCWYYGAGDTRGTIMFSLGWETSESQQPEGQYGAYCVDPGEFTSTNEARGTSGGIASASHRAIVLWDGDGAVPEPPADARNVAASMLYELENVSMPCAPEGAGAGSTASPAATDQGGVPTAVVIAGIGGAVAAAGAVVTRVQRRRSRPTPASLADMLAADQMIETLTMYLGGTVPPPAPPAPPPLGPGAAEDVGDLLARETLVIHMVDTISDGHTLPGVEERVEELLAGHGRGGSRAAGPPAPSSAPPPDPPAPDVAPTAPPRPLVDPEILRHIERTVAYDDARRRRDEGAHDSAVQRNPENRLAWGQWVAEWVVTGADRSMDLLGSVSGPSGKLVKDIYTVTKRIGKGVGETMATGDRSRVLVGAIEGGYDLAWGKSFDKVKKLDKIPGFRDDSPFKGQAGRSWGHMSVGNVYRALNGSYHELGSMQGEAGKAVRAAGNSLLRNTVVRDPWKSAIGF